MPPRDAAWGMARGQPWPRLGQLPFPRGSAALTGSVRWWPLTLQLARRLAVCVTSYPRMLADLKFPSVPCAGRPISPPRRSPCAALPLSSKSLPGPGQGATATRFASCPVRGRALGPPLLPGAHMAASPGTGLKHRGAPLSRQTARAAAGCLTMGPSVVHNGWTGGKAPGPADVAQW